MNACRTTGTKCFLFWQELHVFVGECSSWSLRPSRAGSFVDSVQQLSSRPLTPIAIHHALDGPAPPARPFRPMRTLVWPAALQPTHFLLTCPTAFPRQRFHRKLRVAPEKSDATAEQDVSAELAPAHLSFQASLAAASEALALVQASELQLVDRLKAAERAGQELSSRLAAAEAAAASATRRAQLSTSGESPRVAAQGAALALRNCFLRLDVLLASGPQIEPAQASLQAPAAFGAVGFRRAPPGSFRLRRHLFVGVSMENSNQ